MSIKENHNTENIFTLHKMSITNARKIILAIFNENKNALCNADIEKKTKTLDRITIYRTLQTFLQKGIIHTIPSTDDTIRYALCHHECNEHSHHDNHLHFSCIKCKKTTCIDNVKIPILEIPNLFKLQEIQMVAKGICDKCNAK